MQTNNILTLNSTITYVLDSLNFPSKELEKALKLIQDSDITHQKKITKQIDKACKRNQKSLPHEILKILQIENEALKKHKHRQYEFEDYYLENELNRVFHVPIEKLFCPTSQDYVEQQVLNIKQKLLSQPQEQLMQTFITTNRPTNYKDPNSKELIMTLPIIVSTIINTDTYLINNGIHSAYILHLNNHKTIPATYNTSATTKTTKHIPLTQIRTI